MKRLLIAIIAYACMHASAQKPEFNTYFDTAYWLSDDIDSLDEDRFILDTMPGNRYNKYSARSIQFADSIFGKKVGDGLCGRVAEAAAAYMHSGIKLKYRAKNMDVSKLEVGDFIVLPQFLQFFNEEGQICGSTPMTHLCLFLGMKDSNTMIVADQNNNGNTYTTKVIVGEINITRVKFPKGSSTKPYFDVYGYP